MIIERGEGRGEGGIPPRGYCRRSRPDSRVMSCLIVFAFLATVVPTWMVLSVSERSSSIAMSRATGDKLGRLFELNVPPPPAVRRAGGRERREFKQGRTVVAAAGCAACHRIGDQGNRGPGAVLTRIGSKLTKREIRDALLQPRAPMPSFKGLPHDRLRALVEFLSLLR